MSEPGTAKTADIFALSDLATPWCVYVAATLRVAEQIEAGNEEIEQLAAKCAADRGALSRVLRHLVEHGVFTEPEAGRFALNEAARGFLSPGGRWLRLDGFGGRMAHAWSTLPEAVQTGRPAYDQIFGRAFWDDLKAHPTIAADFDELMGVMGHGTPDPDVLLDGNWSNVKTVVDIGGGTGALLAEVLKAHPETRGILVDFPGTVSRAASVFEEAGVAERVTVSGQSFFDALPTGGDVYLLKSVLSDWPDVEAEAILRRCAEAAGDNGRVIFLNGVSPDEKRTSPNLLMLVLLGGKDRSLTEFKELAARAGLRVTNAGAKAGRFLVECRRTDA